MVVMNANPEDLDFQQYARHGDNGALARVFDGVAPKLLLLAAHLTTDASQAEDLVQITFLQAIRDADRYDGKRPVAIWLAGILRHRAVDAGRRASVRSAEPLMGEYAAGEQAMQMDPAEFAADQELVENVALAIESIEAPYRDVLSLRVVHGLKPTAIAHALGRAPGTVRMQLKRGLERLRKQLPQYASWFAVLGFDSARGLVEIKAAVLREAIGAPVAAASGAGALSGLAGWFGGVLMLKSLIGVAALAVLFFVIQSFGEDSAEVGPALENSSTVQAQEPQPGGPKVLAGVETEKADRVPQGQAAAALDAAPQEMESGDLQVTVLYDSDGSAAANVGLYVRPVAGKDLGRELRTDGSGVVTFSQLPVGRHTLDVDRIDEPIFFDVAVGQALVIRIPEGDQILGRVVNLLDEPIPGARIYRVNSRHHNVLQLGVVADGQGRFVLRDVGDDGEWLARADGYQPSDTTGPHGREDELLIKMGAKGHVLKGQVRLANGKPAPYAWIGIGVDEDARDAMEGSLSVPSEEERRKPMDLEGILLRADENGHFESDEIPAGYVLILAREQDPAGGQIGASRLWMTFGGSLQAEVQLKQGAQVRGVIRDKQGRPVANTRVNAEWEGSNLLGQMEDDIGPFVSDRETYTAGDGSYVLPGLLEGDYDLVAGLQFDKLDRQEVVLIPGQTFDWSPVVETAWKLNVLLTDAQGRPLSGWKVGVVQNRRDSVGWGAMDQSTDSQGKIEIANLDKDANYELRVFAPTPKNALMQIPCAIREGAFSAEELMQVRLLSAESNLAQVKGMLQGIEGVLRPGTQLRLHSADGPGMAYMDLDEEGSFELGGIPAGTYKLTGGRKDGILTTFELSPGQTRNLGVITLPSTNAR